MAETTTVEKKRGRKKAGEAPYVLTYVDAEGNVESRVPNAVTAVRLKANGHDIDFTVDALPANVQKMLATFALSKRLEAAIRKSQDIQKDAHDFVNLLKDGKFYARTATGGKRGRSFDVDLWVDVMERTLRAKLPFEIKRAAKEKREPKMSEAQIPGVLEQFRAKLEAAEGKARNAITTKLMSDQVFKVQMLTAKAERAKQEAKGTADFDFIDF